MVKVLSDGSLFVGQETILAVGETKTASKPTLKPVVEEKYYTRKSTGNAFKKK